MSSLELRFTNGSVDRRELSRSQPLSIGRQPFNDVCIAEDGVGAMHCRISWNKTAFEITAATEQGVDVNGVTVARAMLRSGDIVRIGSVDLAYGEPVDEDSQISPPPPPEQLGFRLRGADDSDSGKRRPAAKQPSPTPETKPAPPLEKPKRNAEDMSLFEGPVYTESQALAAVDFSDEDQDASDAEDPRAPRPMLMRSGPSAIVDSATKPAPPKKVAPPNLWTTNRARPGEQDIFRSPLVMGLSVGGLALLLVTGIFWFLIGREQASRLYDRAVAELNGGQYAQSITSFEEFLKKHPGHSLHRQAERGLGKAFVQKEISGGTPAWKRGLEQVQKLIASHRNEPDFADLHPTLFKYGEDIALGAAKSAEAARDPELLIVSDDARSILERYADPTAPPTGTLGRIKEAREAAERAIGKQNTFDAAMTAVETALANKQPMAALAERERLVRRFPDYANQKRVKEALQKALDLERSVIATDETERAAETQDEEPFRPEPALGLFHTRSRTDDTSQGRVAFALAKDSCYAVDTATGELVWRRVIGLEAPFFPILATGAQPSLLMYDARRQALVCCHPASGKLIWRQKLDGRPRSAPLVHEGQIYLATDGRALCRIDLDSGRLTAKVTFSQNVLGPPALAHDGGHLLIPGEMAMVYSLTMRPLGAAAMTFTDHAAGAITAPPVSMGKLLLLCENDKVDSTKLRVFDAVKPAAPLAELSGARVAGAVRDAPVLRGNQLVVPSSNEHLAAYSVTDEAGRAGLAPVAQYRVKDGYGGAMFVALGPDRQFWSASSAFRRFEIGADSIRMDQNAQAQGIASQPLQLVGEQFFVGRKAPFHDAVVFSAVDRERMASPWRTVVGAEPLELTAARGAGGVILVNEAGQIVSLGPNRLKQGGVDLRAATELELPAELRRPLGVTRLHDERLAVTVNGESAQVMLVSGSGQVEATLKLAKGDTIEANPVLFDDGLVVPLSGRLKLMTLGTGKKSVQDWLAPVGDNAAARWKFLMRLDGNELVACDDAGQLTRIQLRATDVPHLAGASKLSLEQPVDVAPVVRGEMLFVAEATGEVKQLNARSFDVDGRRTFAAPVRGVWSVGELLLVWSGDNKLQAVEAGKELPERWSLSVEGHQPAGAPVAWSGSIWVACRSGLVLALDPASGKESRRVELPQVLSLGLRVIGNELFAIACDGTVYRIEAGDQP